MSEQLALEAIDACRCYIVYFQVSVRCLLQGELLAAVNDTLEALGLPRGSSPPLLSRGQRWLAAHGLSAGSPTDTAPLSEAQQHSASPATSSAHHLASSVSGRTSGSTISAITLPHKSDQEAICFNSGQSAGTEFDLQAEERVSESAAQEQLDTLFAAAKLDTIAGAESIKARSADGIQLQMLQGSTSSDVHLETMLRGVQADVSGTSASSSAYQQHALTATRAASGLAASNLDASAIQLTSMADSARFETLNPESDPARTELKANRAECQMLSPAPQSLSPMPPSFSPVPQSLSPAPQSLSSEPQSSSVKPHDHPFHAMPASGTQPGLDAAAKQLTVGTSIAQQQEVQTEAMGLHSCISPSIAQQDTGPQAAETGQVARSAPDSISGAGSSISSSRAGSIGSSESLSQERHLMAAQSSMAQIEATDSATAALLVDSTVIGRTGSSADETSEAVGSTSGNMEGVARTWVSTAELQLHSDSNTVLDNSIGNMAATEVAQRQSEDASAQLITKASDALETDHAILVGGGPVGTGDQEVPVAVLQAKGDLRGATLQSFQTGARLLQAAKLYNMTIRCCIFAFK